MSIQEIGRSGKSGKEQIHEYPGRKRKAHSEQFRESLMQNLKYKGQPQERDGGEKAGKETQAIGIDGRDKNGTEALRAGQDCVEMTGAYKIEDTARAGRLSAPGIRVNTAARREAVRAAEVRHMSYEESDNIEIAVTEGYTLKGKLEGSHVYVEAKYDDGRMEAYQVETGRVPAKTQQRIEQFAVETATQIRMPLRDKSACSPGD